MNQFFRTRKLSFRYAFSGIRFVLRTQKNAWIHSLATILVILTALFFRVSLQEWALLFIVMGMVWTAEFFNTSFEAIIDLTVPQQHPLARVAKDVGAGSVLMAAIAAVVTGLAVLGPYVLRLVGINL